MADMTPQPSELRTRIERLLRDYDERTTGSSHWTSSASEAWKKAAAPLLRDYLTLLSGGGRSPEGPDDGIAEVCRNCGCQEIDREG